MVFYRLPDYAKKVIPLSLKKRLGAVEVIEEDTEGLETRYCLGCGTRRTFDREARDKCDSCMEGYSR